MGTIKNGYIFNGLDKQYSFTYDGELLQLVPLNPDEIKSYDFLENRLVEKELLNGLTLQKNNIFFLKCRLQRNISGYIAKPAGYICFDEEVNNFRTMVLRGEVVNFFYRPNQILSKDSKYSWDEDGGGKLIINKFSEITKHNSVCIAGENVDFVISISRPTFPEFMVKGYSLGIPKSFIRLEFENDIPIEKFAEIYLWMQNLFEFVNFRKSVFVEDIELGTFNEEKRISKVAEVYLLHKRELDLTNPDSVIGYYFLEKGLNELLQILNTQNLNMLFLPNTENEDKYIDPQRYMLCCSSFESVFNFAFPNAKMSENAKMKAAKDSILEFIDYKDNEYKNKDGAIRKEYKSLKHLIELADFSLAEKYRWCLNHYKDCVSEYCTRVYQTLKISEEERIKEIPSIFADKRNVLIHSNIESIEPEEIAAYSIMRYLIYVIILDKSGVPKEMIKSATDCILI